MILYNVTVKIDHQIEEEWVRWMKRIHIPQVMKTGFFTEYKMLRLMSVDESDGLTYAIQYFCKDIKDYMEYQNVHAPALQKDHTERYQGKFVSFRTIMREV